MDGGRSQQGNWEREKEKISDGVIGGSGQEASTLGVSKVKPGSLQPVLARILFHAGARVKVRSFQIAKDVNEKRSLYY